MVFNSFEFLIFFPIVVAVYFIIPKKIRYIWLLISSYYFYMSWNPKYALLIAFSTVVTFLSGLFIGRLDSDDKGVKKRKLLVAISFIINLGILAVFKYANFLISSVSDVFSALGLGTIDRRLDLLLPVGISFYTFQALSYTVDVYRGDILPEKNILKYALFVSFFPQLVAGPIERSGNLFPQIQNVDKIKVWDFERVRDGFFLMAWGFFQKLVIADRASILVDTVINNYSSYGFLETGLAAVLFALQIYCDFGGYTNIARGAARVMGFELMNNFRQPYFASSVKDFWRRWHISLTSWFTDYLYIPLGGNRKGKLRKYINIIIVFTVSGLWHGASWNYVAWGLIHAIYRVAGELKNSLLSRIGLRLSKRRPFRVVNILFTFILVDFAWIFFVCNDLDHAVNVIHNMFLRLYTVNILSLGLSEIHLWVLLTAAVLLIVIDLLHEKGLNVTGSVFKLPIVIRWILCLGIVWTVIMLGVYGEGYDASTFIYFQF